MTSPVRPVLQRQNAICRPEDLPGDRDLAEDGDCTEDLATVKTLLKDVATPVATPSRSPTPTRWPRHCLLNIDLQVDFISGSLAVPNARSIIPTINFLSRGDFDLIVYSSDMHPPDHVSFVDTAQLYHGEEKQVGDILTYKSSRYGVIRQRLWPRHCVRGTRGASLWPGLDLPLSALYVQKGTESEIESYSVFGNEAMGYDTGLHRLLQGFGITHIYFTGLAEDVCVGQSALDALELGYDVTVISNAVLGVDKEACSVMQRLITNRGGRYRTSDLVLL